MYKEVTLNAKSELLIAGHADCAFDDTLVEIKSIGLGTIRMDAPDLLARHTHGKATDLTGLWRDITRPLRSHLRQGDMYLHLAHVLGLPFTQIVYLYEFKANQQCKEFTVKYDAGRSMKLIAKSDAIKYAVDNGMPPTCIKPGTCKDCNAFPSKRRTVAGITYDESVSDRMTRWFEFQGIADEVFTEREAQIDQWGDQDVALPVVLTASTHDELVQGAAMIFKAIEQAARDAKKAADAAS